jgi:hypothetical protein
MLEIGIIMACLVAINSATVIMTVYKLAKKYNRPWQVVLRRLDKRLKPGYGRISKEK